MGGTRGVIDKGALEVQGQLTRREVLGDIVEIAQDDGRCVGIRAVHKNLHVARAAPLDLFGEVPLDGKPDLDLPTVQEAENLLFVGRNPRREEVARSLQLLHELPREGTSVMVENGNFHIADLLGRGVSEDDELEDGGEDEEDDMAPVPPQSPKLFSGHHPQLTPHGKTNLRDLDRSETFS